MIAHFAGRMTRTAIVAVLPAFVTVSLTIGVFHWHADPMGGGPVAVTRTAPDASGGRGLPASHQFCFECLLVLSHAGLPASMFAPEDRFASVSIPPASIPSTISRSVLSPSSRAPPAAF